MKMTAFCGGGSAALQPYYTVSPYEGIVGQLPEDVEVRYEIGARSHGFIPELKAGTEARTADGAAGLRMRFYRDPPTVSDRTIIDETVT